jgi:hypothetical protein
MTADSEDRLRLRLRRHLPQLQRLVSKRRKHTIQHRPARTSFAASQHFART